MGGDRFDEFSRLLAARQPRRKVIALVGASLASLVAGRDSNAAPSKSKPEAPGKTKCYGGGSHCTNGKQCCSGICTNRRCAPETELECIVATDCPGEDTECRSRTCFNGTCDFIDNPGGGQACDTGLPGVCQAGTTQCVDGTLVCVQNVASSPEVCDGLDNDCDGIIDGGDPGGGVPCDTGLPGVCQAGTTQCVDGALVCVQNVASSPEICDGLDNDCDGIIDGGNPGGGAPCDTGLPGVCQAGTTRCDGGALVCVATESGC